MAAEDALPNRLGAAVKAASGLIDELARSEGDRLGVVAFAGRGVLKCPLTENMTAVKDALAALRTGEVNPGGSDLGAALISAIDAFDDQEAADGRSIVILSDGEDHDDSWRKTLDLLRMRRITVYAVAVGDADRGHSIPVAGAGGKTEELRYQGQIVFSRRNDAVLQSLVKATGGVFVPLGMKVVDLGKLYRDRIQPSARRRRDIERPPERIERFPVFLIPALGIMVATSWPFSRRVGLLAVVIAIGLGAGPSGGSASQAVSAGDRLYREGKFHSSLLEFEEAAGLDPGSPIPLYNAGAALFQLRQFEAAENRYRAARKLCDASLRVKIDYALGNTSVAQGRYKDALKDYDACLSSKATGVGLAAIRRDAATNRSFAARLIPPPATPDPEGDRNSPSNPRGGSGNDASRKDRNPTNNQSGTGQDSPNRNPGNGDGSNQSAPGTADDRLNGMLDNVRHALPTPADGAPPPEKNSGDRKDW